MEGKTYKPEGALLMSKYVSRAGGPVKSSTSKKLGYLIDALAEAWLETPSEVFQSCPPAVFACGHDNARRVLAALEQAGFILDAKGSPWTALRTSMTWRERLSVVGDGTTP